MNGRNALLSTLIGLVAIILIILHFTGVIMTPLSSDPGEADPGSKRFDRITIYNLTAIPSEGDVIFRFYRREDPSVAWKEITVHVPPGSHAGRVFNWTDSDPAHHIVKVECEFPFAGGSATAEVVAEQAVLSGDPEDPALNSATFWFGSSMDDGSGDHALCGEGLWANHEVWVDDRP